jgi:CTP:molybdopterin cytidylyltransferase MocA
MNKPSVAAIFLAAGASERFGQPFIAHITDVVLVLPARPVAVVLGDRGRRSLINQYVDRVAVVQADDLATLQDIDTPEEYESHGKSQMPRYQCACQDTRGGERHGRCALARQQADAGPD